jgi:hypothetical protein
MGYGEKHVLTTSEYVLGAKNDRKHVFRWRSTIFEKKKIFDFFAHFGQKP